MSEYLFKTVAGWESTTLGEACRRGGGNIQTGPFGSQLHAADYVSVGIPSIMPQNLTDNRISEESIARITPEDAKRLSRYLVRIGDIVYSRRGDVERNALVREHESGWLCGTGCLRIRFGHGVVHPTYAAYYLRHAQVREWIVRHAHGATMPNLNTSILSELPFILPPIEDQRTIAHILGALDDKIELNRQINQTLEHIAQAMFKSWFVDFDPVKAKIAAKAAGASPDGITRAAMRAISGKTEAELDLLQAQQTNSYQELKITAKLFPSTMQNSEVGEIPLNWDHIRLDALIDLAYGKAMKKIDRIDGNISVYGSGGITGLHNKALVEGPGIIVGRKGTVGSLYWEDNSFYPIDTVFYVQPKGTTSLEFSFYLLQTLRLEGMNTDAAVPGLNRNNAYRLEVVDVPDSLKIQFTNVVGSIKGQIASIKIEMATLEDIRNALLPKLLSGEINVAHLEINNG